VTFGAVTPLGVVLGLLRFYEILIIVYVLMSWFRPGGLFLDIHRTLGTIVEPWLGIFRKIVPTVGMLDISPIVALIALQLIGNLLVRVLR